MAYSQTSRTDDGQLIGGGKLPGFRSVRCAKSERFVKARDGPSTARVDTHARHGVGVPWTVQKLHMGVRDLPFPQGSPLLPRADADPCRIATSAY